MRNKPFYASPLNESLIYKLRNALKTQIKYLKGIYRASVYERTTKIRASTFWKTAF